ncbi:uncharacterized protein LOC129308813 [Prosopis cineraria]|uniref:uncharacterized protein LOC129308813 n=1 Tax=Prosopis cineraria TaxID=364024 RepID=UPI00240FB87A|nr:uncharacterized protein LOC129308813 [Prosopis cineraria]
MRNESIHGAFRLQILNELMKRPLKAYISGGGNPGYLDFLEFDGEYTHQEIPDKKTQDQNEKGAIDPAFLEAAKGPIEAAAKIVSKNILLAAIKNNAENSEQITSIHPRCLIILLVAVENRQPEIAEALCKYLTQGAMPNKTNLWHDLVQSLDSSQNTILHLAAKYDKSMPHHPWKIYGSAMVMQWEIKWYDTPEEIFTRDHDELVKDSGQWHKETSESCSVVAALVAGVSFATSSQVPGGNDEETGKPKLEGKPTFELFAITSLMGSAFPVTALIMFFTILTSRKQPRDFKRSLPMKLLLGLSSLFVSISSMLIAFCAGYFFLIDEDFKKGVFPLYAVTCLPASYYAIAQFGLYLDLLKAIVIKVPKLHL